jgi:hypothetical protein
MKSESASRIAKLHLIWMMLLGVAVLIGPSLSVAQTDLATVRGVVTDPSGALMPNVTVDLTNVAMNVSRKAVTNAVGEYEIPYVVPGTYQVTCTATGFEKFVAQDVGLVANEVRRLDIQMHVGAAATQVTVTAGASVISTEGAQITGGFTQDYYKDSPLSVASHFPQDQMIMMPMVQSQQGSFALTITGLDATQVGELLDGVETDGTVNLVQNTHATEDLQITNANAPAEFSRPVSFTMAGKSGGNTFHGSADFDEINSALNARFTLFPTKPSFKTHVGFGELSGPLKRDRTFFYVNYTLYRVPAHSFYYENVPDPNERAGNFSELSTPVINPYTGIQFPNNTINIPMSSVSLAEQNLYIPLPNLGVETIAANNYGFNWPHPEDLYKYDSWDARVDHNFSSKHQLFGRYIDRITPYLLPGNFPEVGTWTRNRYHHSIVASDTYSFSSSLVNNFRWGYTLDHIHDGIPELGTTPVSGDVAVAAIGLQGVNPNGYKVEGFPDTFITGISPLYEQPGGINQNTSIFSYGDSLSWAKGRHVAKFGGEVRNWHNPLSQYPDGTYGEFTYDGALTGNAYADYLLGLPHYSTRLTPIVNRTSHAYELGYFAEDTFKVTPNLTLNYGLRWEYFSWPTYNDGLVYNWDPTTGDVIVPQAAINKISPLYPTSIINVAAGQANPSPDKKLWRPRIGAAYRLTDKTVIRGGYGMFSQNVGLYISGGPPNSSTLLTAPAPFSIAETYINQITAGVPEFAMPDPFPVSLAGAASSAFASQSVTGYPSNFTNGIIHEFSISLERQVHDIGLSISYVGNRGRGYDYQIGQTDMPQPSLIPWTPSRNPWPQFIDTTFMNTNGQSKYDGLLIEAKKKLGHLTFDAHYTYANSMANYFDLENPYNTDLWSHDSFTARHRFIAQFVYPFPFGKGQRWGSGASGIENAVLGGWHVNWNTEIASGQYFSPSYSGSDPSNTNTFGGQPDRICNGNLPTSQRTTSMWFNAACFAVPQPGHFGNAGENILEGPGIDVTNMVLAKDFSVKERVRINFSAAFLDMFNNPTYAFPYSNISVPSQVGQLYAPLGGINVGGGEVETGNARAIALRLRIDF